MRLPARCMRRYLPACTVLPALLLMLLPAPGNAQQPEPMPAFSGQTDAPAPEVPASDLRVETITSGLTGPWAMAFLPDGDILVSERLGVLRTVSPDGAVSSPIAGVPAVKVVAAQGFTMSFSIPISPATAHCISPTLHHPRVKRRPNGRSRTTTKMSGPCRWLSAARSISALNVSARHG